MADNDSNTIKPVESLQNIPVLTPAKGREQRRHHQQTHRGNKEDSEQEQNSLVEEQDLGEEISENENDRSASGGIDYCA
ncbi:MAG: hypothetical protein OEW48_11450 [Phycisphaerae bacterium]|nr:hypothetical protein [Phycisphaerae bacterium]